MDSGQNGNSGPFRQFGVSVGTTSNPTVSGTQNLTGGANSGLSSNTQSFAQPQPIISSGAGDIILQPESRKNRKKWVIGGILTIFCIAIIVLILFVVFQNNKMDGSQSLNEINEKISEFSGNVLYGDGRQVDLSTETYSDSMNYKFRREITNNNQEYMESVIDGFESIDSLIVEDDELGLTDDDKNYLGVYKDKLQFLKIYLDDLNSDPLVIVNKIIEEGADEAISYVETQYSEYINSDNPSLRDFFTYKIKDDKLSIDVLSRTNVDECIIENPITFNCEVESLMTEEEILQMQEIQDEMNAIVEMNIKYIIIGCWNIYDIVNGVENV